MQKSIERYISIGNLEDAEALANDIFKKRLIFLLENNVGDYIDLNYEYEINKLIKTCIHSYSISSNKNPDENYFERYLWSSYKNLAAKFARSKTYINQKKTASISDDPVRYEEKMPTTSFEADSIFRLTFFKALQGLSDAHRFMAQAHYLDGMTYREISIALDEMGLDFTEANVSIAFHRFIKPRLRSYFQSPDDQPSMPPLITKKTKSHV